MTDDLKNQTCKPCQGGDDPLKGDDLAALAGQLPEGWSIEDEHHLEKSYTFDDFKDALAFTNRVGRIAEEQGHHPDIYLAYGKVKLKVWSHKIGGLSRNDFIFVAKVDAVR